MPYRELLSDQPRAVKRKWWGRIVCLFWFHDWLVLRTNMGKVMGLSEFHPLAGMDCICKRCGKQWLDADLPDRSKEFSEAADRLARAKAALPEPEPHRNHWPPPPTPTNGIVFKLE